MTCIVGLFDKEKDCVYVGADSLASGDWNKHLIKTKKVFKPKDNKNIVMAVCGKVKLLNVLSVENKYVEELAELKNQVNFEHIVKYTSPRILDLAKQYHVCDDNYKGLASSIIFAYKNQLYGIWSDGAVFVPMDDYYTDGSGEFHAEAVLSQNRDKPTVERIKETLTAAEKHGVGVQRPFYIMNTLDDEVIEVV